MANSPLDFVSSEGFRKKLMSRNLVAYSKSPNRPDPPLTFEYIQSDTGVIDSPDALIDTPVFADQLYPLNQYGADGGYKEVGDVGTLNNSKSNEGEYGFQDANILDQALPESQKWKSVNVYSNGAEGVYDAGEDIASLQTPERHTWNNNQPYPNFNSSSYGPVSILLNPDPLGSDGLLSQDSFIQQLGAKILRREFEARIATQIRLQTTARINIANANSGTDILNMVTGIVPILEPNYSITVPGNPILAATDFALRLAGSTLPVSPIIGSYWDTSIVLGQPTTIQQITGAFTRSLNQTGIGRFFNRLLGTTQSGSQLFLNNTGQGQKSRLFNTLNYNRYKPGYDRNVFDRLAGAIVGTRVNNSNYYVGSTTTEPGMIMSPSGSIPVDQFGREVQAPVYGPSELAQLYEGVSREIRLGANGPTYSSGGGIEGGFTWVSPKYKGNAGKNVGIGGQVVSQDEDFKPSSYNATESTNIDFKENSILDNTQRIIDSQPRGGARLKHVGNAIDQVSKVFNDGYKELTKGSRVLSYVGEIGAEKGTEYCRVFTKDIPYLQYNDLQKTDGMTTEGRRFSYSVLDKTYNLNIYPVKQEGGQDSTNLIGQNDLAYAKKYMFSLENLAWRTSNKPGFTVADLPMCERGPNGGRVMWFPPYDLSFNESVNANWKSTDFLGRPEPVYTYNNTSRSGTLKWKIIVDHPSVLNLIVNKVMGNENDRTRVDSMLESFFAGCLKYDLYELAKKYNTMSPDDLREIQKEITYKQVSTDTMKYIQQTVTAQQPTSQSGNGAASGTKPNLKEQYVNYGLYYDNDIPKPNTNPPYDQLLASYKNTKSQYPPSDLTFDTVVGPNYNKLSNEFIIDIKKILTNNTVGTITIEITGGASSPAKTEYNKALGERRANNLKNYITGLLGELSSRVSWSIKTTGENYSSSPQYFKDGKWNQQTSYQCSDEDTSAPATYPKILSGQAIGCRRAWISNIIDNTSQAPVQQPEKLVPNQVLKGQVVPTTTTIAEEITTSSLKDNISKRVLQKLLTECDYFEAIKQETPMVYDNLKEKLKFFHPAFHSITPEGLNARLTFLQQCMRPGDTIPVIQTVNGKDVAMQYNNATNTNFGAPPVLVLRVGDFFHTKIIPDSLSIDYEQLDLNPEGIGVQPMIANVTMQFKFVGGQGLKQAVDSLQNALSFNFYANTEVYDARSTVTDQSYKIIDQDFIQALNLQSGPPTVNQVQNNDGQTNESVIGTITAGPTINETGTTGNINYVKFMDGLVNQSQNYFNLILNKNKEVLSQYNNSIRQIWTNQRNYTSGSIAGDTNVKDIPLFGKPVNYQQNIDKIFTDFQTDIETDNEGFLQFISTKNFSPKVIRALKTNYSNFVKSKSSTFSNALSTIIQDTTNQQTTYIKTIARTNVLAFGTTNVTGTDGYQEKNGNVVVYKIISSGSTNQLTELIDDCKKVGTSLKEYSNVIQDPYNFNYEDGKSYSGIMVYGKTKFQTFEVFYPISLPTNRVFEKLSFRRAYTILSQDVIDSKKYETFKNALISNIIANPDLFSGGYMNLEGEFDAYWKGTAKPAFEKENNIAKSFLDSIEKNKMKDFLKYTPFTKPTLRSFIFSTINQADSETILNENRVSYIKSLGATTNSYSNQLGTFNDVQIPIIITKVKLN